VRQLLKRLWTEERGQSLSEYALLLLLVSLIVVAGMKGLASGVDHAYMKASTRIIAAGNTESITTDPIGNVDPNQPASTARTTGPRLATSGEKVYTRPPHWVTPPNETGYGGTVPR